MPNGDGSSAPGASLLSLDEDTTQQEEGVMIEETTDPALPPSPDVIVQPSLVAKPAKIYPLLASTKDKLEMLRATLVEERELRMAAKEKAEQAKTAEQAALREKLRDAKISRQLIEQNKEEGRGVDGKCQYYDG